MTLSLTGREHTTLGYYLTEMAKSGKSGKRDVIEAAGGVLTRDHQGKTLVALIHRSRYDDWTFPKGWRERGESWSKAALREVKEETNCKATLKQFVGCSCYVVEGMPKVVLFWHMTLVKEKEFDTSGETDRLIWLEIDEARSRLSYSNESRLLGAGGTSD